MPTYDYRCDAHGIFEMVAGYRDAEVPCACGKSARREPFSGVPYLNGQTVASAIPDQAYQTEAAKREHTRSWGDASRAVDMLRKNMREDERGEKVIDLAGMRD